MTKMNPKGTVIARGRITCPSTTPGYNTRRALDGCPDLSGSHRLTDIETGIKSRGFWLSHSEAKRAWGLGWSSVGKWDNEIEIVSYPVAGYVSGTRYGVRRSTRSTTPTTKTADEATMKKNNDDLVHYDGIIEQYHWVKNTAGLRYITVPNLGVQPTKQFHITPDLSNVIEEAFNLGREVEIYVPPGTTVATDTKFLVRFKPEVKVMARGIPCGYHYSRANRHAAPYFTVEMPDPACVEKGYGPIALDDMRLVKDIVDDDKETEIEVYVDPKCDRLRVRRVEK